MRSRCSRSAPGNRRTWTNEYVRHGTQTTTAALEIATGNVAAHVRNRRTSMNALRFMNGVVRAYPESMSERERPAEARHLPVRIASEEGCYLGFAPLVDGLWQGVLSGGISSALLKAARGSRTVSRCESSIAFLAGFLPAFFTTAVPVRRTLETRRSVSLERRYQPILQGEDK